MAELSVTLDLARVQPEAQLIVERAARVYIGHMRPWLVGLLLHGSAVKGGFILGCSDVDFQLYLRDDAFDAEGELPLELAMALHRDLARVDPAPFNYLQCFAHSSSLPAGQVGPIPGAYALLTGALPIPEATAEELLTSARAALRRLTVPPSKLASSLLSHGEGRLERHVRLLCTDIWPTLYHVLAVRDCDPIRTWGLSKPEAIAQLPSETPMGMTIRAFNDALVVYYPSHADAGAGLRVLDQGVSFLRSVQAWWTSPPAPLSRGERGEPGARAQGCPAKRGDTKPEGHNGPVGAPLLWERGGAPAPG